MHRLEGRCLQRLRPTGRKNAQPPIDEDPAKELQAAPLSPGSIVLAGLSRCSRRLRGGCYDGAYQPFSHRSLQSESGSVSLETCHAGRAGARLLPSKPGRFAYVAIRLHGPALFLWINFGIPIFLMG